MRRPSGRHARNNLHPGALTGLADSGKLNSFHEGVGGAFGREAPARPTEPQASIDRLSCNPNPLLPDHGRATPRIVRTPNGAPALALLPAALRSRPPKSLERGDNIHPPGKDRVPETPSPWCANELQQPRYNTLFK